MGVGVEVKSNVTNLNENLLKWDGWKKVTNRATEWILLIRNLSFRYQSTKEFGSPSQIAHKIDVDKSHLCLCQPSSSSTPPLLDDGLDSSMHTQFLGGQVDDDIGNLAASQPQYICMTASALSSSNYFGLPRPNIQSDLLESFSSIEAAVLVWKVVPAPLRAVVFLQDGR